MNIVLITTGMRPDLLVQSMESLANNAADWSQHHLTLVFDAPEPGYGLAIPYEPNTEIVLNPRVNASAARNIGAGSIPKYRRQENVLFLDDDVYMCPGWDEKLNLLSAVRPTRIYSGYSHPYNVAEPYGHPIHTLEIPDYWFKYGEPLVISSVAMMMPWKIFDDVGPWDEPGGPGGSEDYAICMRAKDKGYGFAVTDPQCVIHTGLTSSRGEQIVGYKELAQQNWDLIDLYQLKGKVTFA